MITGMHHEAMLGGLSLVSWCVGMGPAIEMRRYWAPWWAQTGNLLTCAANAAFFFWWLRWALGG